MTASIPGVDGIDALTDPAAVEGRVWRNIFAVIGLSVVIAAAFADLKITLGLALGGALALFNYKWLHSSLRDIMAVNRALASDKTPTGTAMKFIFRWMIVGAAAYGASLTGYFDVIAILAGLFAPALAVMIEAAYVTYKTLRQEKD